MFEGTAPSVTPTDPTESAAPTTVLIVDDHRSFAELLAEALNNVPGGGHRHPHHDPQWATRAAQAGASAFIPKDGTLAEMIDLLSRARHGQMLIGSTTFLNRPYQPAPPDEHRLPLLSHRELDGLPQPGHSGRGHGARPGLSVHTCRGYMKTLHTKMGVRTQLEAVIKATQLGILGPHR